MRHCVARSRDTLPLRGVLTMAHHSLWLRSIVSGFFELQHAGLIALSVNIQNADHLPPNIVALQLAGGARVLYDANDGYNFLPEVRDPSLWFDNLLDQVDVYFKASFIPEMHSELRNAAKLKPLGIISGFHGSLHNPYDTGLRPLNHRALGRSILGLSKGLSRRTGRSNRQLWPSSYERLPDITPSHRAVFIARLWDPQSPAISGAGMGDEVRRLNVFRRDVIRLGRRELGPAFLGGLVPSEYADRNCPDCVLHAPETSSRWAYLRTMHSSAIGIATAGLHSCASGKLAEYLAASRAVVSERLKVTLPGDFSAPANYLEASTPEECIAQVGKLLADNTATRNMMLSNWQYYETHLRPSAMILRSLMEATRCP